MNRFKRILVTAAPGRLDPTSLRRAGELASANEARVTLLGVVEPLPRWRRAAGGSSRSAGGGRALQRDREAQLRHFADMAGLPDAEVVVMTGKPAVEVIRHVAAEGCDLVVVGEPVPAPGGIPGVSAGVLQLLRRCPVPVWALRPNGTANWRILALVDPDPTDPVRDGLNDVVLELAVSMTGGRGVLHVAHAWELHGQARLASTAYAALGPLELSAEVENVAEEVAADLEAVTDRHRIDEVGGRVHVLKGNPGTVLPQLAKRLDIDVIVMGTVARTGLGGLLMGNTAETILRTVDCSVLALKPAGFVSPDPLATKGPRR